MSPSISTTERQIITTQQATIQIHSSWFTTTGMATIFTTGRMDTMTTLSTLLRLMGLLRS